MIAARDFLLEPMKQKHLKTGIRETSSSTLRKVDVLANIAERAENSALKTNATWWEIHGGTFGAVLSGCEHRWHQLFSVV